MIIILQVYVSMDIILSMAIQIQISRNLHQEKKFIYRVFQKILYQIIELLIEDILIYSLEDTIRLFKDKKIYTRSLRERISKVESEKDRILILIEKCELHSEDYNSLHEKCVAFLVKKGRENVNFPESLYSVRNFIVHDYRFIVEETELAEINDINALFEMFVLDLIIKYKH